MRASVPWLLLVLLAACAHSGGATRAQRSETVAASAAPSAAPTPAYTDIEGVPAAPYIDELTQLQVFWPPGGLFEPNKPVLRREFARWLFYADEAIWGSYPNKSIHPGAPDAVVYFSDVPAQDPDFAAIQGLHQAGVVLAKGRRFYPNAVITREQALAIKAYVDCGAASCALQDASAAPENRLNTVQRTFGNRTLLQPQRPLTRAEAAAMIWRIGQQKPDLNTFPPRDAADALAPGSTATP